MILAVVQARFTSSRLPGKILKPILNRPMLMLELERVLRAKHIDHVVVATSLDKSDDPVESMVHRMEKVKLTCFRGSLDDVLDRFFKAAKSFNPDHVVRITGDCPLIDPMVIDEIVGMHIKEGFDFTSNCHPPTFPDGLDVEVMKWVTIESAWKEATLDSDREHVTPFIWRQPERFRIGNFIHSTDLSEMRWTVDEPEDFEVISKIYKEVYPTNPNFLMRDVLEWFSLNKSIGKMNSQFKRNAGYQKSLVKDLKAKS